NPEPYHNSVLTGIKWLKEMQRGHPDRMKHNLGVHGHVFKKLKKELQEVGSLR
ncbi:hypothetical protein K435DRAFT_631367, partial [Dendrothele bispora CBS 962.96]